MHPRFSGQIVMVISLCLTVLAAPMAATDCADWNSSKYFRVAGVERVAACLASGANPKDGGQAWRDALALNERLLFRRYAVWTVNNFPTPSNQASIWGVLKSSMAVSRLIVKGCVEKISTILGPISREICSFCS